MTTYIYVVVRRPYDCMGNWRLLEAYRDQNEAHDLVAKLRRQHEDDPVMIFDVWAVELK